ncbi:MAG: VirB8/TrbF family protein [Neisseriaceae bacterium]
MLKTFTPIDRNILSTQRKKLIILTIGSVLFILVILLGVLSTFTYKNKLKPNVIRLSNNKTYLIKINSEDNKIKINNLIREQLVNYVNNRESYSYFSLEMKFKNARDISAPDVANEMNNHLEELKKLIEKNYINFDIVVTVNTIRVIKPQYIEILFNKTRLDNATGDSEDIGKFNAYIKYDFNREKDDDESQESFKTLLDPTNLRITSYQVRKL